MKKIIILIIIIAVLSPMKLMAQEFTSDSNSEEFSVSANDYIPENVKNELINLGVTAESDNLLDTIAAMIIKLLSESLSDLLPSVSVIFVIIFISALFSKIIDNTMYLKIINFISTLVLSYNLLKAFSNISQKASETLLSLSEVLTTVIPSFCAVLLLGGGNFSAMTAGASLGCILTVLKLILSDFLTPFIGTMFALVITEKLAPSFGEIHLSATLKKYFMTVLSFVTMLMLTVISFQNILASSKDSVSARALKFTASNFIPVVGGAVSESLKTVGAGVKYLKSTVGISVALALFSIVIPCICMLFSLKIILGFLSLCAGLCGAGNDKSLIESFVNIIDILLGIIICITVLSVLVVILFVTVGFSLGAI